MVELQIANDADNIYQLNELVDDLAKDGTLVSELPKYVSEKERLLRMLLMIDPNPNNWVVHGEGEQCLLDSMRVLFESQTFVDYVIEHIDSKSCKVWLINLSLSGWLKEALSLRVSKKCTELVGDKFFYAVLNSPVYEHATKGGNFLKCQSDVYTCGENAGYSLGNPLGTSRQKRLYFDMEKPGIKNFDVTDIMVGQNTTIYLGRTNNSLLNAFFVSGKFGEQHFMTPKIIETEEPIRCIALGSAHLVVCCEKIFYAFGDNSCNQLGYGPSIKSVSNFRSRRLSDVFPAELGNILSCATSKNHTVIRTENTMLVAGVNCGQLGPYASRTFNQPLGPPKLFTRLLAPDDTLNRQKFVKIALADDITVLYVGSKVKVFFEYNVYGFSLVNSEIHQISICKSSTYVGTTRLIIWTTSAQIFVWTKSSEKRLKNPLWDFADSFPNAGFTFSDIVDFNCSLEGEFFFVHRSIAYAGSLSGVLPPYKCFVHRLKDSPGFVEKVLISPTGRNLAFLVRRMDIEDEFAYQRKNRKKNILPMRLGRFTHLQMKQSAVNEGDSLIQIKARVPSLIDLVMNDSIDLTSFGDETVEAMIEYVYSGMCHLFILIDKLLKPTTVSDSPGEEPNDSFCDLCGKLLEEKRTDNMEVHFNKLNECCRYWIYFCELGMEGGPGHRIDVLERKMKQLEQLADVLSISQFHNQITSLLTQLSEIDGSVNGGNGKEIYESIHSFIQPNLQSDDIFPDSDAKVRLHCSDGEVSCSKVLLCSSVPYFEAFFRWNGDAEIVELAGISIETAQLFVKFLISYTLEGFQLTIEQLLNLFVFSDHFGITDLMDSVLDMIRENVHLGELIDICKLAVNFYSPYLDAIFAEFLFLHLPFLFEWENVVHFLSNRLSNVIRKHFWKYFAIESLPTNTIMDDKLNLFIQSADAFIEALPEKNISPIEFLHFLKLNRRKRDEKNKQQKKRCAVSESDKFTAATINDGCPKEQTQLRLLSESADFEQSYTDETKNLLDIRDKQTPKKHEGASSKTLCIKEIKQEEQNNNIEPNSMKETSFPLTWASHGTSPHSTPVSLEQVMIEEQQQRKEQAQHCHKASVAHNKRTDPMNIHLKNRKTNVPAWGESFLFSSKSPSLMTIQSDERHGIEIAANTPNFKPIHLVEIEEQAILELANHYMDLFDEDYTMVKVSRIANSSAEEKRTGSSLLKWRTTGNGAPKICSHCPNLKWSLSH